MRVLITGASGMVGRNLTESPFASKHTLLIPSSVELNLRDYSHTISYMIDNKPDLIIHAAGRVGGIQANIAEPVSFLVENLDIGRNVVLAACEAGVQKLINLASSCIYPCNGVNPLKEEMVLSGKLEPTNEGYALAKIMTARLCQYLSTENSDLQFKTLIPCNLYGLYDKFEFQNSHMVPAVIHKLYQAKLNKIDVVDIWGDGTAKREFMFASDAADCIWRAAENIETFPNMMNIGLGYDLTINEYYTAIAETVGYKGTFKHDLSKPVGMKQKLLDTTLVNTWGWKSRVSLCEGLNQTFKFYCSEIIS